MKQDIHPEMHEIEAICACGSTFKTSSTKPGIKVTICSQCHPFFTKQQKFVDTAGRIEKFQQRYKKVQKKSKK